MISTAQYKGCQKDRTKQVGYDKHCPVHGCQKDRTKQVGYDKHCPVHGCQKDRIKQIRSIVQYMAVRRTGLSRYGIINVQYNAVRRTGKAGKG
jgi:hypothetical protein